MQDHPLMATGTAHHLQDTLAQQHGPTCTGTSYPPCMPEGDKRNHHMPGVVLKAMALAPVQVVKIDSSVASTVTVTAESGEVFTAQRVVCAVPLGVLQSGGVEFVPALPASKSDAIQKLGMGVLNKVGLHLLHTPEGEESLSC